MTEDLKTNYSKAKYHSPQKIWRNWQLFLLILANAYYDKNTSLCSVLKVVS